MLVVILLNTAVPLPPQSLFLSQLSSPWPVRHSQSGSGHLLFEIAFSLSQELILQGERQSKKVLMLVHRSDAALQKQQKVASGQLAPVPLFCLVRFFLPRKLSPPSTTDDSFLS